MIKLGGFKMKLRYGIIVCGGIFKNKHAKAFVAIKNDVEVVAFCDLEIERA